MRRLLPLLVVGFLLVGVGATPALADHRADNIVRDPAGNLQPDALDVFTQGGRVLQHNMSGWYLTTGTTVNGVALPAGSHLTVAQATWQMTQPGGLAAVAGRQPTGSYAPPVSNPIEPQRQKDVDSQMAKARRKGRLQPGLKAGGSLVLAVVAGELTPSRALKMEVPGQGLIYELITGNTYTGDQPTGTTEWRRVCAAGQNGNGGNCDMSSASGSGWSVTDGWILWNSANGPTFAATTPEVWGSWQDFNDFALNQEAIGGTRDATTESGCQADSSGLCFVLTRTDEEMEALMNSRPMNGDEYDGHSGAKTNIGTYNRPTINDTDITNINTYLGDENQTIVEKDTEDAVRNAIAPGTVPSSGLDPTTGTSSPTPVEIIPPATTVPDAPALDFSPLTDIDFGCKFPYGFLCYAVDVTETFDVSPDAPRFVFDVPTVNVGIAEFGGGEDGWVVDLEVMDDWAAIWRDIWSVVIVIGAVYLVATRLLGFKAGGDPGEAMDDV